MMRSLKNELRKILTVRTTYITLALALMLNVAVSFWVMGYKMNNPVDPHYLQNAIISAVSGVGFFVGITPLLLITHEYRHNTIYYTFTAARSRTMVLFSKLAATTLYALVFLLLAMLTGFLAVVIGLQLGNHTMPSQQFDWWLIVWRSGVFTLAVAYMAAIFGFLIRNQIGAFVTYLLYPGTVEALLGLLLRDKAQYLPFYAISEVASPKEIGLGAAESALVAAVWILFGLLVSWVLFLRRDAN